MQQKGFTLIELMTAISVAAILSTVGIPSFSSMIQNNKAVAEANSWHATLTYARSESIKRNMNVTICQSANGIICTTDVSWNNGWIMFVDGNADSEFSTGEEILKIKDSGDSTADLVRVNSTDNYISYTPTGNAAAKDGSPVNTEWKLCIENSGNDKTKVIAINNSGRAKVKTMNAADQHSCS